MIRFRILADDLTGALDSAAQFAPLAGAVPVFWGPPADLPWPAAVDAGTRELDSEEAAALTRFLVPVLEEADPAFKKLDSLLRGHPAAEIAACLSEFDHCIIATAFPAQGRITRDGRQFVAEGAEWRLVGPDLRSELAERGVAARLRRPGEPAPDGVSLWDAASESALDQVVAEGRCLAGRVLWCGTAGLASALAGRVPVPAPALLPPILALIGSDHHVSVAQLSAAWSFVRRISRGDAEEAAPIARRLARDNVAVAVVVPPGMGRPEAGHHIAACLGRLLGWLDPPATLLVSGGETLRAVCRALGAARLDVDGQVAPGVPASVMRGGRWDGVRVVSKSGAFGDPGLLARLLHGEAQ
ncbi:MAG TPA: four-carbon acid sugar kinase family protein [Acetobacteraceae bacterium]|nr:four-carbon acid sugar kinase family protein [Acetobacteraceae bacterium]